MLRMVESVWMEMNSSYRSTLNTALVGSATRQMTLEPMRMGLPWASLTFCLSFFSVFSLRETAFLPAGAVQKGLTQKQPGAVMVP